MSAALALVVERCTEERVTVGALVDAVGDRAFGLLMVLLALPNLVPVGIPGVSTVFGVPLALVALQLALGRQHPWLPRVVTRRSVARRDLERFLAHALPRVRRVERWLRPRLTLLTSPVAERLIGLVCLGLAVILALPIPGGNFPPALAIALFALGVIEHDGWFVVAGLATTVLALTILALIAFLGAEIFGWVAANLPI